MVMADDLSIPSFLRASGPGTPCPNVTGAPEVKYRAFGESCWEEMQKAEWSKHRELKEAVAQYKKEAHFAEQHQWAIENPEEAKMNAKARRDAKRRLSKLGIPPAKKRYGRI